VETGEHSSFWVRVEDVIIMCGSVHTIQKNAEALVVASKEIGLEVNADKTKYIAMSRDQTAGRSYDMKINNVCVLKGGAVLEGRSCSNIWDKP
jgi:hypothetical protein